MRLKQFEQNKVKREIKMHGSKYSVFRCGKDEYGEQTKDKALVAELMGLFHVSNGYQSKNVSNGTVTHSKAQPMLLCIYEEQEEVKIDDFVLINNNIYKIVSKTNVYEENIVSNLSLELVLNENQI